MSAYWSSSSIQVGGPIWSFFFQTDKRARHLFYKYLIEYPFVSSLWRVNVIKCFNVRFYCAVFNLSIDFSVAMIRYYR